MRDVLQNMSQRIISGTVYPLTCMLNLTFRFLLLLELYLEKIYSVFFDFFLRATRTLSLERENLITDHMMSQTWMNMERWVPVEHLSCSVMANSQ